MQLAKLCEITNGLKSIKIFDKLKIVIKIALDVWHAIDEGVYVI